MANIAILGSGGWGTALAVMLDRFGHQVTLWSPFDDEIAQMRRFGQHKKLLPDVALSPRIILTTDITCAVDVDLVIMAVPSFAIRETAKRLKSILPDGMIIANAGKGLEDGTHLRFSTVIKQEIPQATVVALSGPSHAEEVARAMPTSLCAACADLRAAQTVQDICMNPTFRVYTTDDIIGVELGGALKNVVALAAGIIDGLNLGDNSKAALMTRGLAEMARLGTKLGARTETFAGLSGIGDLIVTCGSMHSRNRRAGILIGQGCSPEDAVANIGTVEGYLAAKSTYRLACQLQVDMPIVEQCYAVCYKHRSAKEAVDILMNRPKCSETELSWL